jgi:hypothetical protein
VYVNGSGTFEMSGAGRVNKRATAQAYGAQRIAEKHWRIASAITREMHLGEQWLTIKLRLVLRILRSTE